MAVRLPGKARLRFFESTMDGVEADYTLESSVAAYLWSSKLAVRRCGLLCYVASLYL
jgi:hypothetical protein